MVWNGLCIICITLKELWTRVSSRSMTMHFFPASCGRMAGSRGFWPGDTGATWGAADELHRPSTKGMLTQQLMNSHVSILNIKEHGLKDTSWFCPLLAQTGSLPVDQYRVFTVFVTVSYKGPIFGSFLYEKNRRIFVIWWFWQFHRKGLKIPRAKKPKMEWAYLLDDSFWSVTSELDEGCFEEPLLV